MYEGFLGKGVLNQCFMFFLSGGGSVGSDSSLFRKSNRFSNDDGEGLTLHILLHLSALKLLSLEQPKALYVHSLVGRI